MAIYCDWGQRFLDGTHRSAATALSLPARIAFWINTDGVGGIQTILAMHTNNASKPSYCIIGLDSSIKPYVYRYRMPPTGPAVPVTDTLTATNALSRNTWHHVCVEWLGYSDIRLTVDGTDHNTSSTMVTMGLPGNIHFGIGCQSAATNFYPDIMQGSTQPERPYRGYLADFAIWRGVAGTGLTSGDRQRLAQFGRTHKYFDPGNLNVYMPMRGGWYDEVNLDTVASVAFWNTVPTLQTRYAGWIGSDRSGNPTDGDTVTVGGTTYTFRNSVGSTANEVLITGSTGTTTLDNLRKAIELTGVSGTDYGSSTTKNATCMARTFDNGNDTTDWIMYVQEIDPTATGTGPALTMSITGGVYQGPFDIDGNSISNLVAPPEEMLVKRPDWFWSSTASPEIGVGANNHGHNPPVAWHVPFAPRQKARADVVAAGRDLHCGRWFDRTRDAYVA